MYAAAGPSLRHGNWRGSKVQVCTASRCVVVTLIDWCACPGGRVIDLYSDAFTKLAPLSRGVLNVTVSPAPKEKEPVNRPTPSPRNARLYGTMLVKTCSIPWIQEKSVVVIRARISMAVFQFLVIHSANVFTGRTRASMMS